MNRSRPPHHRNVDYVRNAYLSSLVREWGMKVILRGDSAVPDPGGNLFVVNIQQIYESREEEWTPANAIDAILGRPPRQDLAAHQPSMLERIKSLSNLMVLNEEKPPFTWPALQGDDAHWAVRATIDAVVAAKDRDDITWLSPILIMQA